MSTKPMRVFRDSCDWAIGTRGKQETWVRMTGGVMWLVCYIQGLLFEVVADGRQALPESISTRFRKRRGLTKVKELGLRLPPGVGAKAR